MKEPLPRKLRDQRCYRWPSFSTEQPATPPPWLDRTGTVAAVRAFCLWAESPRWARVCWWPIWRWRWPPAKTAPVSPSRRRAVFWSASSNCPSRSLSAAWRPCAASMGAAADQNLLVDTRAAGHLLSAPQG